MSSTTSPLASAAPARAPALPSSLVLLMATGTGLAVASIYYSQPLLGRWARACTPAPAPWAWCPR
jgi:hypothetical protein